MYRRNLCDYEWRAFECRIYAPQGKSMSRTRSVTAESRFRETGQLFREPLRGD